MGGGDFMLDPINKSAKVTAALTIDPMCDVCYFCDHEEDNDVCVHCDVTDFCIVKDN